MKRLILISLLLLPSPAFAQSNEELKKSIELLQNQVSLLQARADIRDKVGDSLVRSYLDVAFPGADSTFMVAGWGFNCVGDLPTPTIIVDGIPNSIAAIARYSRMDVNAAFNGFCTVPEKAGITFLVDLRNFAPGRHTISLRMWDIRGAVIDTNTLEIVR